MTTSAAQNISGSISQWVTFSLNGEIYGIDVMQVQEVLRMTPIAPVPGAPHFVLGIVNLRGNVVTVVDTRVRFGLMSKEPDEYTRIIIVEAQDVVIGLLVDAVAEVVEVPSKSIETSPSIGGEDSLQVHQRGADTRGLAADPDRPRSAARRGRRTRVLRPFKNSPRIYFRSSTVRFRVMSTFL